VKDVTGRGDALPIGATDGAAGGAEATGEGEDQSEGIVEELDGVADPHPAANRVAVSPTRNDRGLRTLTPPRTAGILASGLAPPSRCGLAWSRPMEPTQVPDWIQRAIAGVTLVVLAPAIAVLAVAVRIGSPGPSFYGAARIGRGGATFTLWKLRTMRWSPGAIGPAITGGNDRRITRLGAVLRRTRLDELPQLWNVVRGEMRLVGPRPEDPRFVDLDDPGVAELLELRPGITGLAQLAFANEATALGDRDPEATYRQVVVPRKLLVDRAYLRHRSAALDLRIAALTITGAAGRPRSETLIDHLVGHSGWRLS
jgi:lipopolysaccharide/colanic/teichoic acid biosynthesis glycosyltransferase